MQKKNRFKSIFNSYSVKFFKKDFHQEIKFLFSQFTNMFRAYLLNNKSFLHLDLHSENSQLFIFFLLSNNLVYDNKQLSVYERMLKYLND